MVDFSLIPNPTGSYTTIAADITERREAEDELRGAYSVIASSIQYASRIQRSVLQHVRRMSMSVEEHFILWEPRDVVGGDVYCAGLWGDGTLIVLGDCTGLGVPSAFMTLIAAGALERACTEVPPGSVEQLVNRNHQLVQITLGQHVSGGESDDELEHGACYLQPGNQSLTFVGCTIRLVHRVGGADFATERQ